MPSRSAGRRLAPILALLAISCACGRISESPLQKAIQAHDLPEVERLLSAGAYIGPTLAESSSASKLAVSHADAGNAAALEILRRFVAIRPTLPNDEYSNPCTQRNCGTTSAIEIAVRNWNLEAVELFVASGLDLRSQGTTDAVVYGIAEGNDEAAMFLVEAGADPSARASGGNRFGEVTPLEAARKKENAALVDWLLARGAR